MLYVWKKREQEGRLANEKPVPKNIWWAISPEKETKVIALYEKFPEIATNYALGIKAGVSPSSAGRIKKRHLPQELELAKETIEKKVCTWLKLHTCWSIDTIKMSTLEGWLYIQVLLEEYSRVILGWMASMENSADRAVILIEKATAVLGVKPLILKFDRGSEFKNSELKSLLEEKEITGLVSPRHYPGFNGKLERENQLIEKFLPEKGGISIAETYKRLERAMYCLNHELPRRIFDGKTSAQIYSSGEKYTENEREILKRKILEYQKEIEFTKNPRWDKLDVERKAVVKSVVDLELCVVKTRTENANQLLVVNV